MPRLDVLEDRTLPSVFTVTNLLDSGAGSLRQTILDASSTSEDNTILFAVTGTISLTSPLPDLGTDLNIQGPGADSLTVQRSTLEDLPEFSVFTIYGGATVNLTGLTIANGSATLGGGIFNNGGILTVSNCILTGNSALRGGGITNFGSLTISDSTLAGNAATSKGGGIANFGQLAVSYSTFSGNSASSGGAIYNFEEAILTVSSSTLAGNSADFGGGIDINGGMVTVTDSTLAANSATYDGGGIENDFGATLTIGNTTISGNSGSTGGGILNDGTVTSRDSILAGNTAVDGPDLSGSIGSEGHNLIGDTTGCDGFDPSDLLNVDPLLGPLQDNGGPTWTMALLPGSPAIGTGDTTDAPDWDQRGEGFPRIVDGLIDIGAFEVQAGGSSRPEGPASSRGGVIQVEAVDLLLSVTASNITRTPNTTYVVTASPLEAYGHTTIGNLGMPGGDRSQAGPGLGSGVYVAAGATVTADTQTITLSNYASTSNGDVFGTMDIVL